MRSAPQSDDRKKPVIIILKKRLAVLALALAVTSLASPSYAQGAGGEISAARAAALQQCSYFNDSDWDYA